MIPSGDVQRKRARSLVENLLVLVVLMVSACSYSANQQISFEPSMFVGDYVFRAADRGFPHGPDELKLKSDGTYVLVHISQDKAESTQEGTWELFHPSGLDPKIELHDVYGLSVEVRDGRVRLVVSYDRSHWFEKIN
jgi:hypothetical protein